MTHVSSLFLFADKGMEIYKVRYFPQGKLRNDGAGFEPRETLDVGLLITALLCLINVQ